MDTETKSEFQLIHKQFEKMDQRFEQVDNRFEKMDNRFEKTDLYIKGEFSAVNKRIDSVIENMATKQDIAELNEKIPSKELINNFYGAVDKLVKVVERLEQNQLVTDYRVEKVETWVKEVAPKVKVEFHQ